MINYHQQYFIRMISFFLKKKINLDKGEKAQDVHFSENKKNEWTDWASLRLAEDWREAYKTCLTLLHKPCRTKVKSLLKILSVSVWAKIFWFWSDMDDKDSWDFHSEFTQAEVTHFSLFYHSPLMGLHFHSFLTTMNSLSFKL